MGLDVSHGAFSGAYSAFNRLRQQVARAAGGSFPPHYKYDEGGRLVLDEKGFPATDASLDRTCWYVPDERTLSSNPGLYEFLGHSDCDGDISPEMSAKVAAELESLLPVMMAFPDNAGEGHIARDGGYAAVLAKFIAGCRAAADAGESLAFY